jgi:hypothetical protein
VTTKHVFLVGASGWLAALRYSVPPNPKKKCRLVIDAIVEVFGSYQWPYIEAHDVNKVNVIAKSIANQTVNSRNGYFGHLPPDAG